MKKYMPYLILVSCFILGGIYFIMGGFTTENKIPYATEKTICEEAIKKDLNDPFSTKFEYEQGFNINGYTHFTGYMYGKNSFNATIKKPFLCKIKDGSNSAETAMLMDTLDPNKY